MVTERQRRKATTISNTSRNNLAKRQTQNCNHWSPVTVLVEELDDDTENHEVSEHESKEEENSAAVPSSTFSMTYAEDGVCEHCLTKYQVLCNQNEILDNLIN